MISGMLGEFSLCVGSHDSVSMVSTARAAATGATHTGVELIENVSPDQASKSVVPITPAIISMISPE